MTTVTQGCQMAYFQTKITNLGKFWRALQWKMLAYFMVISSILQPFGIFCWSYGILVYIFTFWYVIWRKIWQPCCDLSENFSM
jgi:hypothetical protein